MVLRWYETVVRYSTAVDFQIRPVPTDDLDEVFGQKKSPRAAPSVHVTIRRSQIRDIDFLRRRL